MSNVIQLISSLSSGKRFMNKIGDLDYYTATELVVLRTAEIEVFYEVKSGGSGKT